MSFFNRIGSAFGEAETAIVSGVEGFGSEVKTDIGRVYVDTTGEIKNIASTIGSGASSLLDRGENILVGSSNSVGGVFNNVVTSISTAEQSLFTNIGNVVGGGERAVGSAFEDVVGQVGSTVKDVAHTVGSTVQDVTHTAGSTVESLGQSLFLPLAIIGVGVLYIFSQQDPNTQRKILAL